MPPVSQLIAFANGGFWDVTRLGWPAEFQLAVWLCMSMVAISMLNLVMILPVIPVTPRTGSGLVGVAVAPFMHGSPLHLIGNILGVLILAYVLSVSNPGFWLTIAMITIVSGLIYWLIGPPGGAAVGASDAAFGAWAYWMVLQWYPLDADKIAYLGVMAFVFGLYLWQAFAPTNGGRLSHLIGAAVGVGFAVSEI